ncbi:MULTISPECIES: helix-turn-helix domain-containing protein [unclassified Lactococcus]|uniref:helix-turn-helix domain-containing protein n=1 Tax=unclassified Lactococcus TaxID=2643510 RepID=UPI0011CA0481|nr:MULTISPECIES: helix-turn-helix transcriptional regulator [unclassified Lactococcus]MQW23736.1 helix-turn-helix domain-containing protein [Lactococcus sp. dk101]TXK37469.1 helix-turn-helix transcriptional regulator [Lactococcus sp. dk310]TXK48812.1 helix-turn-helix transcriptional regulator [Lactococcus sp. dk322]
MRTNEEIVKILISEKEKQGLSLSEIARRVDMAKSALSRYFNFSREFPLNKADDFAKVLNISTEYLLGISKEDVDNSVISKKNLKIDKIFDKLDTPRQEKVVDFAENQLKEQTEQNNKVIPIGKNTYTDEELMDIISRGVASDGTEQTEAEKEFFFNLIKNHLEGKDEE